MVQNSLYRKKALQLFPAMEIVPRLSNQGVLHKVMRLKTGSENFINKKGETRPSVDRIKRILKKVDEEDLWPQAAKIRNVFLVTDNTLDAREAACLLGGIHGFAVTRCGNGECEDEDEYDDWEMEGDESDYQWVQEKCITPVCFDLSDWDGRKDENAKELILQIAAMEGLQTSYFEGLEDEKYLSSQLDAIRLFPDGLRCVRIPRKLAKAPEIQELTELDPEHNCMIELEEVDFDYYCDVCKKLLQDEGAAFADENEMREALLQMMRRTGELFSEEWIGMYLDKGLDGTTFRLGKMFGDEEAKTAAQKLKELPGLQNFKELIRTMQALVREESRNPHLRLHKNWIFAGNPGSGKTMSAHLAADILAGAGATRPVFVAPSRSDLIGKFVGQTAPKVREAFERARGGVLFVDEAGFFLNRSSGGYVDEAIREFVRYMEMYPDVTVIFAMYANEAADFLRLDEGLRSRVSRVVKFEDYSVRELCDISTYMLRENGYTLAGGEKVLQEYFESEKNKEGFGNARAARKLVESVILSISLARCDTPDEEMYSTVISESIVKQGIRRLKREGVHGKGSMGFLAASVAKADGSKRVEPLEECV